jgi:hypothetical protein
MQPEPQGNPGLFESDWRAEWVYEQLTEERAPKRREGEVWKGASGHYFTKKDGRIVPTAAPGGNQQQAPTGRAAVARHIVKLTGAATGAMGHIFRRLKIAAGYKVSPTARKKLRSLAGKVAAVEHFLSSFKSASQDLVERVAKERGATPEVAARAKKIATVADAAAAWTVNVPAAAAGLSAAGVGGVAGAALSKVAYYLPVGSLAYLAYSTSRNPLATLRAARKAVAERQSVHEAEVDQNTAGRLVDLVGSAQDPDACMALVLEALERTHYDLAAALDLVGDPGQIHESEGRRDGLQLLLEGNARQTGEKWQGASGRWFTKRQDGRVVPTAAPAEHNEKVVSAAHEHIKGHLAGGKLSAQDAHELAGHLLKLSGDQLRQLKQRLGLRASGPKYELASKLAARALAAVRGEGKAQHQRRERPEMGNPQHKAAHDALGTILGDLSKIDLGDQGAVRAALKKALGEPEKKVNPAAPEVFDAMKQAWNELHQETLRIGGIVKVPDLVDRIQAAVPGITAGQIHQQLLRWQKEDKLTVQTVNDPRLEPRRAEMIQSPRGLLGYVQLRTEQQRKTASQAEPAAVARHFADLARQHRGGVSLADLHDAVGGSLADLHATVQDLRRQGVLSGQGFEGRAGTPEEKHRELAAGMDEGHGGPRITRLVVRDEDALQRLLGRQ